MKVAAGGGGGLKKRWRGLVIGVLGLVVLSMLVPLLFLLGLHTRLYSSSSPSASSEKYPDLQFGHALQLRSAQSLSLAACIGYAAEHTNQASLRNGLKLYDPRPRDDIHIGTRNHSKGGKSAHKDELISKLGPTIQKDFGKNSVKEDGNKTGVSGLAIAVGVQKQPLKANNTKMKDNRDTSVDGTKSTNESEKLCELRFGSYCLWRQEHRENMNDSTVKKMKDLLYVARAYFPSIAKLPALDKLSNEMKQNIQDFERVLSESTTDEDLPLQIRKKITKMEAVIQKAKSCPVDCNNVDKKFRQLVDLTEDETNFHTKQSAFLFQLAVQTMPKSLHCLSMQLAVEYFRSFSNDIAESLSNRHMDPDFQHYVLFSNNVLASSVVINSTVTHAKETENQVFHVLTDRENFFALKMWFFKNKYKKAVVQVLNIEELDVKEATLHLLFPEEFCVSFHKINKLSAAGIRTEYISVFSHLHFWLPMIFPTLKKIVVLDDDVVIQRDLSSLWSLNMDGKAIGAVQVCTVKFGQLKNYFGGESFDEESCAWMSGINIVDLVTWRQRDLTKTYQRLLQKLMNTREGLSDTSTLVASLLTFQGEIYALDDEWVLSGLGHNYGLDIEIIEKAPVLHFNGNMKPWLELGISEYSEFWSKFLNQDNQFLRDCNVNTLKS